MREKYIDESVGVWIIFGSRGDGKVDVADQTKDIFINLPVETANKLVDAQEEFRQKVYDILRDH